MVKYDIEKFLSRQLLALIDQSEYRPLLDGLTAPQFDEMAAWELFDYLRSEGHIVGIRTMRTIGTHYILAPEEELEGYEDYKLDEWLPPQIFLLNSLHCCIDSGQVTLVRLGTRLARYDLADPTCFEKVAKKVAEKLQTLDSEDL